MFEIGALELFVIVIVAVVVIGPKDMPLAMRTAGRWVGKVRRVSAHFRTGIDAMVREAELEDMEKEWKARNEEIMRKSPPSPGDSASGDAASGDAGGATAMTGPAVNSAASVEATPPAPPKQPASANFEPANVHSPAPAATAPDPASEPLPAPGSGSAADGKS